MAVAPVPSPVIAVEYLWAGVEGPVPCLYPIPGCQSCIAAVPAPEDWASLQRKAGVRLLQLCSVLRQVLKQPELPCWEELSWCPRQRQPERGRHACLMLEKSLVGLPCCLRTVCLCTASAQQHGHVLLFETVHGYSGCMAS